MKPISDARRKELLVKARAVRSRAEARSIPAAGFVTVVADRDVAALAEIVVEVLEALGDATRL